MDGLISVVIPVYNAEEFVSRCLESICCQTYKKLEILVIDGGSTDSTKEIARKYDACIIENPHKLPEPAKVIGFKRAKGRYVCIMDTDEVICRKTSKEN